MTKSLTNAADMASKLAKQSLIAETTGQTISTSPESTAQRKAITSLINFVFEEMKAAKPAWKVAYSDYKLVRDAKKQWLKGFIEENINSEEMIQRGLTKARADTSDFVPGLGKFMSWCKGNGEGWQHNTAAYKEYRPDRLLPSETSEDKKESSKRAYAEFRRKAREDLAKA